MKKLRRWIEIWMDGREVKGIQNVPPATRYELVDVYNAMVRKEHPTFINSKVKEIIDKCGIETKEKGIGWIVL